ncbi:MAG: BlaI/MecI/CopY family transcriptional regulator [Planctomycetota bacterium]
MTNAGTPLTPAEWKIMHIAWRLGRCAAREVYEVAGEQHGMAPSTVKTHLRRLVDKGYLQATRVGNSFLYKPRRQLLRSLFTAADRLLEKSTAGTAGALLAYMVKKSRMTEGELDELRALLEQVEPAAADGAADPNGDEADS